jgi:exodeoxyribonuclease I
MKLVSLDDKKPFVYTSGRYDIEHEKTTVAFPLTAGRNGNVVVYDLRYDPADFISMDQKQLAARLFATWEDRKADGFQALPVKELQYNRAPAVAPLGVLEQAGGWERIHLDSETVERHKKALLAVPAFAENIRSVFENQPKFKKSVDAEAQLYEGFINGKDKIRLEAVRTASVRELADFHPEFDDERLPSLLLRYKARNFPDVLSESEVATWESWRSERIKKRLPAFMKSLERVALQSGTSDTDQFLFEELRLWAESVVPDTE